MLGKWAWFFSYGKSRLNRLVTGKNADLRRWQADLEELTDIALAGRGEGAGLWKQMTAEIEDEEALRSNIRVFLVRM